jgi:thiamine pyrophosphokinase
MASLRAFNSFSVRFNHQYFWLLCKLLLAWAENVLPKMTYKSILCLNGDLPHRDFFENLQLSIIAADGAANKLAALGIKPHLVIGDLDSVNRELDMPYLYVHDQSRCDYEKSMDYLKQEGLLPTIVLGTNGGDLDHILNNISVFMSYPPGNLLYAAPIYGTVLNQSQTLLQIPIDTKVSIIGVPQARVVTKGLEWDLTGQSLSFPGVSSCLNRTIDYEVSLTIKEGQVLVLAHNFFVQIEIGP